MKKLTFAFLIASTPVMAGSYGNDDNPNAYVSDLIMENAKKPIEYYQPPMPETEHPYQFRSNDGSVSRGWMRKLD